MNKPEHIIEVKDLVKKFGSFTANDRLSFHVEKGEIFGFLGANGAGKTTAIRILCGLSYPTSGDIRVAGHDVYREREKIKRKIGYMSQKFSLYEDLTVSENIRLYAGIYGLGRKQIVSREEQLLEHLGIAQIRKRLIKEIPLGWKQKLAFSVAIFHEPAIVFLDEPTGGVDPITRRQFWEMIHDAKEEGITVFVTTHYMDEAEHCHRLAFIQKGEIIAYGSPSKIKNENMGGQVLEITSSSPEETVRLLNEAKDNGELDLIEIELYGSLIHVVSLNAPDQIGRIRSRIQNAGIDPGEINIIKPSLEDVFIACMKE